ncbi:Beta-1,4-N-acetylgalactosaminyltransferase bre-4 [Penaeus vannamei]|uniref:Beta-1,4-N-acetylgalactosaminyltransferase bre-4 n=1 Tax=Penaeus vannamei TaxID=6689 RepID=A0A3R7SYH0_PENVA|nr:Beta-1,4-N-acetylgalactosaminyltransferase bre-4 [Penaeus vannamei]
MSSKHQFYRLESDYYSHEESRTHSGRNHRTYQEFNFDNYNQLPTSEDSQDRGRDRKEIFYLPLAGKEPHRGGQGIQDKKAWKKDCRNQRQIKEYPQQELYCQRSISSCEQKLSAGQSFSYLGGRMYPPPSDGGLGRFIPSGGSGGSMWSGRVPVCRPRFWKLFLLVILLLMMAQFSLNILFYRNYDSLFYVNVTSAETLATFESKVRWVSSKLPWLHSTTGKPPVVAPLHHPGVMPSSSSHVVGDTSISGKLEEKVLFSKDNENESQVNKDEKKVVDKSVNSANNSKLSSVTSKSKELSVKAPSKVVNGSDGKADAKLLKIPQINKELGKLPNVSTSRVSGEQKRVLLSKEKALCPPVPPKLVGSVKIYRSVPTLEEQEKSRPELEPGGRFRPAECRARHRVAIIIPYRDRVQHLAMFIYHIHPILQRQQIDYAIYVVEQAGSGKFNRAMLMNVGALEALKQYPYDCFIFHDVDLLPEDDRNLYTCPEQPRHMSIAIDSMGYKLPYNDIFGGVSAMTADQFRTVNGFSNKFWGWGGEDDDMSNRIKFHGFFISRYPANIGRYTMLSHKKDEPNPRRYHYLYDGKKRFKSDGLNSVKYRTLDLQLRRLYTWVYVDLYPS